MFFILGMPRSGTTLLAQCLNAHSKIVIPHETDFIVPMSFIFDRVRDAEVGKELIVKLIVNSAAYPGSLGEYLNEQAIHETVYSSEYQPHCILNALYAKLALECGAELAGDKSPNDLNFLRMLVKTGSLSTDMKIIHIVRDIRDVMVSVNQTGWGVDLDLYFPRFWCNNNLYLNSLYRNKPNYLLIRYEDLVSNPENEIVTLTRFLSFEFEHGMMLPENRHQRYKNFKFHENLYHPISNDSVEKYKDSLDEVTRRNYETQAREALIAFGYRVS